MPRRAPFHVQDRAAGGGLVTRLSQEGEKLRAGDVIFAEGKGFDGDVMERSFGVEAAFLGGRPFHHEKTGRYADHDRAFRAFLKFAILLHLGGACPGGG